MKNSKAEASRCVVLTESGLARFHEARRRYRLTIEAIAGDSNTPSVNTVKRALGRGPVFVDTLERIWDYLRGCAESRRETLADLVPGDDYVFAPGDSPADDAPTQTPPLQATPNRRGWLSRQVPRPNRLFLGRQAILQRLHAALKPGATALLADAQALTGMGGIGKTQTAIAYVYAHRQDFDGVFWIASETVEDLQEGLAAIADELKLLEAPSASRQEALEKIHDWFQTRTGWLLVLDNADDLHTLAAHFPRHHTGSLLLTTRGRNTTLWAAPIEITKFDRTDGALLILRRAGLLPLDQGLEEAPASVRQAAERLSDELDGLPLALDQAGAYLAETQISVGEYLQKYRESGLDLLDRQPDPTHSPVVVTFELAISQVTRRGRYGQAAVELLSLCAFLAPDSIPETIVAAYPFPQDAAAEPRPDPEYYAHVRAVVCGYSLLRRDAVANTLTIHRLVQRVISETLSDTDRRLWRERVVQTVADATPDFEFEDWSLCDQLLPHWRICAEYIKDNRIESAAAAYLLHQAGRYVRARALYAEAEPLLTRSLEIARRVYGENHRITADYLDHLACLYRELDRADEAQALHEQAVAISEVVSGLDHGDTAGKLHNLALLYADQQNYASAEACFTRALAIRERELSPDHPGVAMTLTQLGGVYRGQGRSEEAEICYQRAVVIFEKTREPNHIDIAIGCNNLALLYVTTNRPAEAEPLYLRALRIHQATRGADHPETAAAHWGLALAQWRQNRAIEANQSFRSAIAIYQKLFEPEHTRFARLLRYYEEFRTEFPDVA